MKTKSYIIKAVKSPLRAIQVLFNMIVIRIAPLIKDDRIFIKLKWRVTMNYPLNLENPQTFCEKIQWLKLYYHRTDLPSLVDKVSAKDYVQKVIGSEHIIPTIGVYDSVDAIPWNELPNQYVLKCTHDSGGIVVCKDKSELDIKIAKKKLSAGLQRSYYAQNREWPYRDVPRKIIAEQYMVDESGYELKDYKWFCFNGEPKMLFIATDRGNPKEHTKFDFYDCQFNHLPILNGHPNSNKTIAKPTGFDEMKKLAGMLSKGFPHVRIDLYDIKGHIYFGEMTFFHFSGFVPIKPYEWDEILGSWIVLPEKS